MFWLALIPLIVLAVLPGMVQQLIQKHIDPSLADILNEAFHKNYFHDQAGLPLPLKSICKQYKNMGF